MSTTIEKRRLAADAMVDAMPCTFRRLEDVSGLGADAVLGFIWLLLEWGVLARSRTNNKIREEWGIEIYDLTPEDPRRGHHPAGRDDGLGDREDRGDAVPRVVDDGGAGLGEVAEPLPGGDEGAGAGHLRQGREAPQRQPRNGLKPWTRAQAPILFAPKRISLVLFTEATRRTVPTRRSS